MGRSNGYRPRKAVEEEVKFWRDKLNACHSSQWQKAGLYMQNITALLGHSGGPMQGRINPRACKVCHYYGHTKQWCPVKKARDEREAERVLKEDRAYFEKHGTVLDRSTLTLADFIAEDPVAGESRWRWKCENDRLMDRFNTAVDTTGGDDVAWWAFVTAYDARHPPFPAGVPDKPPPLTDDEVRKGRIVAVQAGTSPDVLVPPGPERELLNQAKPN